MQHIQSLHREYFQKSKVFLYPALGIPRGSVVTPVSTHIIWDGIKREDGKLICTYLINHKEITTKADRMNDKRVFQRDKKVFQNFERFSLKGNKLFDNFVEVGEQYIPEDIILKDGFPVNQGIYIFNLSKMHKDWHYFLHGKYSRLSLEFKKRIKDFFKSSSNYVYIESFLHPEKYYAIYSELLDVKVDVLKRVGELTSPPNFNKETLKITINTNTITK